MSSFSESSARSALRKRPWLLSWAQNWLQIRTSLSCHEVCSGVFLRIQNTSTMDHSHKRFFNSHGRPNATFDCVECSRHRALADRPRYKTLRTLSDTQPRFALAPSPSRLSTSATGRFLRREPQVAPGQESVGGGKGRSGIRQTVE